MMKVRMECRQLRCDLTRTCGRQPLCREVERLTQPHHTPASPQTRPVSQRASCHGFMTTQTAANRVHLTLSVFPASKTQEKWQNRSSESSTEWHPPQARGSSLPSSFCSSHLGPRASLSSYWSISQPLSLSPAPPPRPILLCPYATPCGPLRCHSRPSIPLPPCFFLCGAVFSSCTSLDHSREPWLWSGNFCPYPLFL